MRFAVFCADIRRFIYGCLMIFAVAGVGSAQEIRWGGMVDSGVKASWGDNVRDAEGEREIRVQPTNEDGVDGVRALLNAIVYNESRGVKIGIRADYGNNSWRGDYSDIYFYNAYGWVNLLNNKVNVKAGIIDDGVWVSPGAGEYNYSTNRGLRVELKPMEGLNTGAFMNFGGGWGPLTLSQWIFESGLGTSYSQRPFDIAGAIKLASDRSPDNQERIRGYMGWRYWGISNFVLSIDGQLENMGNFTKKGFLTMNERIIYQIKDLYSGITFTQVLLGQKNSDEGREKHSFYFKFNPFAEYGISNAFRIGAEMPFDFQDEDGIKFRTLTFNPWLRYSISGAWIKLNYVASYVTEHFNGTDDGTMDYRFAVVCTYYF